MSEPTNLKRKQIGSRLQKLRKAAGYKSAKAFAEYAGINPNTYTQYEQGIVGLSFEKAWEIADALNCTLDEIGGRSTPECHYADRRQEELNGYYECMNETGKQLAVDSIKAMSSSVELRVEKSRAEGSADQAAMGA